MDRMHGYWWSPDSKQIAYQETDTSGVEELAHRRSDEACQRRRSVALSAAGP